MKKNCIRLLSAVMSIVLVCGLLSPAMVSASSSDAYINGLQKFIDEGNHAKLVDCSDAVYMEYAELLRTDVLAVHMMHLLGLIYGGLFHGTTLTVDLQAVGNCSSMLHDVFCQETYMAPFSCNLVLFYLSL